MKKRITLPETCNSIVKRKKDNICLMKIISAYILNLKCVYRCYFNNISSKELKFYFNLKMWLQFKNVDK